MKTICIYHGNCADGFGAAWVLKKYFDKGGYAGAPQSVDFVPGIYQAPPPDVKDAEVFLVDFSYKRDVVIKMLDECKSLTIIDHHLGAINQLEDLVHPKLVMYFDVNHSGAMLTWKYFFGSDEAPQLLKHIEDRDLWKFLLQGTRPIQANLFSFPYDFEVWNTLMRMDTEELLQFEAEGIALERKHFKDIHEFIKVSTRNQNIGGVILPVVNCPYMWGSDAAHILAENRPEGEPKVAGYYWDGPGHRTYGLRSIGDFDCNAIAQLYGGGGHKNASGFKIPASQGFQFEFITDGEIKQANR
jgi:oligoribonuclease NrnB/cAMP/cGMP phosphodiesterase (DHH superfamily)